MVVPKSNVCTRRRLRRYESHESESTDVAELASDFCEAASDQPDEIEVEVVWEEESHWLGA